MVKALIYPSVLALKDNPTSWDSRIQNLPIPLAGVHYDIGDGDFVPSQMLRPEDI
jgi:pentose-5-phosphate-3-epimerase